MDPKAVRTWGMAASGTAIVGALALASFDFDARPSAAKAPSTLADPSGAAAAPISFVVHFEGEHPLVQAQELAARGDLARAEAEAQRVIRGSSELRGLCFDRFTIGGAEIVLRACDPLSPEAAAEFQRAWVTRLQGMSGVDYAEANLILGPETDVAP